MKRNFLIIIVIFVAVAALLFFTGRYPVALVGRSPVWLKTWQKAENAVKKSHNVEAGSSLLGEGVIDFDDPKNAELLKEVRRGTLSVLIEDRILYQEGTKEVENLEELAESRVNNALQGKNIEQAFQFVYGLSLEDFRELVLLPQARREVLAEDFSGRGKDFDEWILGEKKSKKVSLYFVPFSWDGEEVR